MKKYLIYTFIIGLFFTACNPNKDIYDIIDDNKESYFEEFDLELTDADLTSISKFALQNALTKEDSMIAHDLDIYKSFSSLRSAANLIPPYLGDTYIALNQGSQISIKYKFSVNDYDSISVNSLNNNDYVNFFGISDTCFSSSVEPAEYILSLNSDSNYVYYISCKYGETYASSVDTSIAYTYINGNWIVPDNFYILTNEDYEKMGRPGQYHNFSDSDKPENYLPNFLMADYPYEESVDVAVIFYKYFSGSTSIKMDAYKYVESEWINRTDKISPFIHNGENWLFDPTIRYNMVLAEDFQIIVDYVTDNPDIPAGYIDDLYPETTEYYYGANSYYKNFYLKLYKRRLFDPLGLLEGLSDEEAIENMFERINEAIGIFLEAKYPDAEPIQNGVEVYYAIAYETYEENSVRNHYAVTYKCIGTGEFEYISGPDLVE